MIKWKIETVCSCGSVAKSMQPGSRLVNTLVHAESFIHLLENDVADVAVIFLRTVREEAARRTVDLEDPLRSGLKKWKHLPSNNFRNCCFFIFQFTFSIHCLPRGSTPCRTPQRAHPRCLSNSVRRTRPRRGEKSKSNEPYKTIYIKFQAMSDFKFAKIPATRTKIWRFLSYENVNESSLFCE